MNEQNQKGLPNQAPSGLPPAASSFGGPVSPNLGGPVSPNLGGPVSPSLGGPVSPSLGGSQLNRPTPPPPPPPEITIRTMKSDLESLKETGGSAPAPKPFTPPEFKPEAPRPMASLPPPPRPEGARLAPTGAAPQKITPSDFGAPKIGTMQGTKSTASPIIEEEKTKSSQVGLKKILLWVGILAIAIGVGLIGYFYLFPMLFPSQEAPAPMITAPVISEPEQAPAKNVEVPAAVIPAIPAPHQSLLKSSDETAPALLASVNALSIMEALQAEASKKMPAGTLAEIIFSNAGGQIPSSEMMPVLLPEMTSEMTKNLFADDFTAVLYYDANGAWPAYVLKLKLEANIVEAQSILKSLESSLNLSNLFLTTPGTPNAAGFKDGKVNDLTSRYLTFSNKNAALNLIWSSDRFIISTSYNGLKKLLTSL